MELERYITGVQLGKYTVILMKMASMSHYYVITFQSVQYLAHKFSFNTYIGAYCVHQIFEIFTI